MTGVAHVNVSRSTCTAGVSKRPDSMTAGRPRLLPPPETHDVDIRWRIRRECCFDPCSLGRAAAFTILSMRLWTLCAASAFSVACSGGSPTAPAPATPTSPAQSSTVTITGHLTATNGAQPLGGIIASLGPTTTSTTDDTGRFALTVTPFAAIRVTLQGTLIVPRSALVAAATSRDVSLDAIALGGGFDLEL
jgi:hypothetical protein